MRPGAAALLASLAACASSPPRSASWTGPTYTRAAIAEVPTAQLASTMLSPERAAEVVRHEIPDSVYHDGRDLQRIHFYQRPYPLAPDICLRQVITISFADPVRYRRAEMTRDLPKRIERAEPNPQIALLPACAEMPGRRFARLSGELSLAEGVEILRRLFAAHAAAGAAGALPFRLRCIPVRGEASDCTAADRAAFAAIPLHAAIEVQRRPGPGSCQPDDALGGDLVLFDRPGPGYWQVRMIGMGSPEATILLSADGRRAACL